jgi:hypothetical protein
MRVVLAFLVMGWVINLIFAMASHEPVSIGVALLYLAACAYGVFLPGLMAAIVAWMVIGIGFEAVFIFAFKTYAPAISLVAVLFWSGLAIFAGNLFRRE